MENFGGIESLYSFVLIIRFYQWKLFALKKSTHKDVYPAETIDKVLK